MTNQQQHPTKYRVTARRIQTPGGKTTDAPFPRPFTMTHRPGPDKIYAIIGPDRELAVENCPECRRSSPVVDNRNTKG